MMTKFIPSLMLNKCPNIHCTSANFKTACRERIIRSAELGRNGKSLNSIGLQPPLHPQAIPSIFYFHRVTCHHLEGTPPSNSANIVDYNMVLGVLIETPMRRKNIWTTLPHGLHLVCAPSLPIDVEMALEDPAPQGVVVDIDVVEALSAKLEKWKLDNEQEFETDI